MTNTKFRTNTPPKKKAANIQVDKLRTFEGHPFKVLDDEDMNNLTESIKAQGIISPLIVRAIESTDEYEVISGHRRLHAAIKAGLSEVPALIYPLDRSEAMIAVVDSNLHREKLLPSEKAFAYKMKMDAMKQQGKRTDLTLSQAATKSDTAAEIGKSQNESRDQVFRYIRLTYLIPELLDKVDGGIIALSPAVELSYLSKEQQKILLDAMNLQGNLKKNRYSPPPPILNPSAGNTRRKSPKTLAGGNRRPSGISLKTDSTPAAPSISKALPSVTKSIRESNTTRKITKS
ncbi:ParB/RepB/Spo0J family partition protein [Oscillospiraceae bacterium 21-37]